jgi:hypothetical protein
MPSDDVWDVALPAPDDAGGAQDLVIVKKTEVEARQAFAEAIAESRSVQLRRNGEVVETSDPR